MTASRRAPELLAPAGTLRNLRYALAYGADAVYAGIPRYSLRVRNNDFGDAERLAAGIALARARGRRFYLAVNLLAHGAKLARFVDDLAPVIALGPDALIMADPGLILLVRERWPELPVHLSVQANTTNAAAVRFWQRQGIRRVILSRELSIDEVAAIRDACPDTELEVFVHGALCIAYSGRCLLSGWLNHRDANQGACTNACRWSYQVRPDPNDERWTAGAAAAEGTGDAEARHPLAERGWLLEDPERPEEPMPLLEDTHGSYILNSRDLRALGLVERLVAIGVDALKIEGRTKSHYYTARTTSVYRRAIDDAAAGRAFEHGLFGELDGLCSRGYTEGFLRRHAVPGMQNYSDGSSRSGERVFVGEITGVDAASGLAEVAVRNRFALGDRLELLAPGRPSRRFVLEHIEDGDGRPLAAAPGDGWRVRIGLPSAAGEHPGEQALLARVREAAESAD